MSYSLSGTIQTIIPMKPLATAKSRLKANVDSSSRTAAILMMLDNVIRAVKQNAQTNCRIIGGDNFIRQVATENNVEWLPDPSPNEGLNNCLWNAMSQAYDSGSQATLFLPGDLPLINSSDILKLLAASQNLTHTVLAKATKDGGTNAMLQPAEQAFKPMLGKQSFAKHKNQVIGQSIPFKIINSPGLEFDLDNDADYEWAVENVKGFQAEIDWWIKWVLKGENSNKIV